MGVVKNLDFFQRSKRFSYKSRKDEHSSHQFSAAYFSLRYVRYKVINVLLSQRRNISSRSSSSSQCRHHLPSVNGTVIDELHGVVKLPVVVHVRLDHP